MTASGSPFVRPETDAMHVHREREKAEAEAPDRITRHSQSKRIGRRRPIHVPIFFLFDARPKSNTAEGEERTQQHVMTRHWFISFCFCFRCCSWWFLIGRPHPSLSSFLPADTAKIRRRVDILKTPSYVFGAPPSSFRGAHENRHWDYCDYCCDGLY